MKLFNKLGIIAASTVLGLGFIQVGSAEAGSIGRSDFNSDATVVDFEGASGNTFTDGNLSVSRGTFFNRGQGFGPRIINESYFDRGESGIRLDFLEEVSALGMDFVSIPLDITFSVFDKSNNLIESLTLDPASIAERVGPFPTGFIGLDVGSNLISYAIIDVTSGTDDVAIDNVVYQSAAVPEPASILGLLAISATGAASLKRKFAKAKEAQNA